jgi:hypothetical protein
MREMSLDGRKAGMPNLATDKQDDIIREELGPNRFVAEICKRLWLVIVW